ncbi:class I SAM-dependent methyltransferase [Oxynema aestuarii]|jgi:2-polyprenyl-3-methyl-5-hydroxy-6-metoxy-1,4-benzoquinol methylase|uniref:Methyltransferase domain-containing protein n=1 Tax=Oxynema aestuarii AP17 TaxID=2064643 RepID=A0A6H1TRW4_9CYAN|nr:class I SAM-dependent methyltransferase [Oxynema aestuarii]QIZ69185.1 methyltransferase domain-containing protein [Oxynema aestuarii AP17]RMH77357.1 MAG: class I SAM-dependent methyltransferase [Cyanobacteria bacterium J007]
MLEEDPQLQSVFDRLVRDKTQLKVLEVGCGSCSYLDMGANTYLVGIDLSEKQLERNTILDEKILGDVETYNFPENEYDVIVCWWILEHLDRPERALANCQKALKKDGILIVAVPNVMSLKGLLTKYTPHQFHVWVYRYIFGEQLAGVDDRVPFRTFLRQTISPKAIQEFARHHNLNVEHFYLYENPRQKRLRNRHPAIDTSWKVLATVTKALTFGQIDAELTDFIAVLRKTEATHS